MTVLRETTSDLEHRVNAVQTAYEWIGQTKMRDLPIYNPRLRVATEGFRLLDRRAVGIVITPWFMNLTLFSLGDAAEPLPCGICLPAGEISLATSALAAVGAIATCSLFSPMDEFADMAAARQVAGCILSELFDPAPEPPSTIDRRALLRGRIAEAANG